MERMGDNMVSLFLPKGLEGVFVEDNQATTRIFWKMASHQLSDTPTRLRGLTYHGLVSNLREDDIGSFMDHQ